MNYADFIFSLQAIQDLPDSTSLDPRPILHSSRRHKSRTKERADSLKENKDGTSTKEVQVDYTLLTPSFRRVSTIKSSLYHICLMFMLEGVNSH